jgi:hypothetical protein
MPRGICSGCGGEEFLPPFGDGMCFLCATDGPPGDHTPTGSALAEGLDARREAWAVSDADFERRVEILGEFDSHQAHWARAIGQAHYRSQRFVTWTRPSRNDRIYVPKNLGPTVEELKARVERRQRQAIRAAAMESVRIRIESRVVAHEVHADRIQRTINHRNGSGNYAPAEKIELARDMRGRGLSLRAIARETGLSKCTVQNYVPWIPRPEAMRLMHARLKSEGRPVLPPWAKARAQEAKP